MTALRFILLPWLILVSALGLTWLVWDHERQTSTKEMRSQFDFVLRDAVSRIEQRVASHEQLLRGVQGLFATTELTNRIAVRDYVETIQLDANFSGVEVIGVVEWVAAGRKDSHQAAMRQKGFAGYSIYPAGEREAYVPIVQREPYVGRVRNTPYGRDVWADPVRRIALERARDSGMAAVTGKVQLTVDFGQETQPGFIMYLPVFARGKPHADIEQRRANLVGWVYAAFRMSDFMASTYGPQPPGIALTIFDGVAPEAASLLYASTSAASALSVERGHGLSADEFMVVAGHSWLLTLRTQPDFESRFGGNTSDAIALAGVGLSLSLAGLVWLMVTARARALRYAELMTEELRLMAQQDPLTGLPNRALFGDRLKNQIASARRHQGRFALIFLDLDNFKGINDTYGHGVGDVILMEVAQRLRTAVRTSDTVGRLGGDEFVVLMPELSDPADAMRLAEKIRISVREPIVFEEKEMHISCSLGVAVYPDDGRDEAALVRSADQAMYRAKERGRDAAVLAG